MTATIEKTSSTVETAAPRRGFILLLAGILSLAVGIGSMAGGVFGAWYTWDQAVTQDVVTPNDAVIADTPVRGPFTMWAQADIINQHQLNRTDGLYFAQMDRTVPMVDESGAVVLDEAGEVVMVPNEVRASWLDATTLTTALSLGIVSYALATFAFVVGLTLVVSGLVFLYIRRRAVLL